MAPYGNTGNPGPEPDDYFSDGPGKQKMEEGGEEASEHGYEEFVVPKAAFGAKWDEFKPGDEVVFKVQQKQENGATMVYAVEKHSEEEEHEGEGMKEKETANPGSHDMASMMY